MEKKRKKGNSGKREKRKNAFRVFELFFFLLSEEEEEEEGTQSSSRVLYSAFMDMGQTQPHFYTHLYLYLFTVFPALKAGGIRIVGGAKRKKTWTFFAVFGLVGL